MGLIRTLIIVAAVLTVAACGTRTGASVTPAVSSDQAAAIKAAAKPSRDVIVTENDITDRPYVTLADIEVSVEKWTIFDADPTREMVTEALRKKATEVGADAVVLARYGTVGLGVFTWGKLDGKGRAVVFKQ